MSRIIFFLILIFISIFRIFFSFLFIVLKNFHPKIKHRLEFERLNLSSNACQSFRHVGRRAKILFHVSSEGELEQARSLLTYFLNKNILIELVYTSDSVEKKCNELYLLYPNVIRILRLPLLSSSPFSFLYFQSIWDWATSEKIVMCRYDFFPELLLFKLFGKKMILISGTTKRMNFFKKIIYQSFDYIVAANQAEQEEFKKIIKHKIEIDAYDLRIPRIFEREKNKENVLHSLEMKTQFLSKLKNDQSKKIIFGSLWESDTKIFDNKELQSLVKNGEISLVIAPHKLNQAYIDHLLQSLAQYFSPTLIKIVGNEIVDQISPISIITVPGILCELYSLFEVAYIGCGFEKSVHSVLEPYLMGAKVICGPKIERSTEVDFLKEQTPLELTVLNHPDSFYNQYKEILKVERNLTNRAKLKNETDGLVFKIAERILSE